jgi:hypothetical protein
LNTHALDKPCDRAAGNIETLAAMLPSDLPDAVDPPVLFDDPMDIWAQSLVQSGHMFDIGGRAIRSELQIGSTCEHLVARR